MADETRLDAAHAAMEDAPENGHARLRFFEQLAATELFLLLEEEARGASVTPRIVDTGDQRLVLVFDREDRLARFAGPAVPYAALSGRAIAGMLAEERLGMGVNLDVAPSAILLPAEAVAWLAETLAGEPAQVEAHIQEFRPPVDLPEALVAALDARLASAAGMAHSAYLAGVVYDSGARGHMLAVIDPVAGAEPALARAVSDLLRLSGVEAASIDVAFFRSEDTAAARLARVGLRFDLPRPDEMGQVPGANPGMDPDSPPRLR